MRLVQSVEAGDGPTVEVDTSARTPGEGVEQRRAERTDERLPLGGIARDPASVAKSGLRLVAEPTRQTRPAIEWGTVSARGRPSWEIETPAGYRRAKRLFDVFVAAVGLVACAPLILVLVVLVRLDSPGPAFFRQIRVGQGGRLFVIIKMRSMRVATSDEPAIPEGQEPDAGRVTRVGRYLRRWSLDELPQLINVLRGDMSLVGPRPERPEIVMSRYEDWQYQRFLVPQGLTGWWQVTDRGHTMLCDDTQVDLFYLARASFGFDLKILMMTLPAVVRQAREHRDVCAG